MQRADHEQWKSADVARLLALVESERRYYEELFTALPLPVAIVDGEWRLAAVNRNFKRRFGPFPGDLTALRLPDLIPDPALEGLLGQVLATGQVASNVRIALGQSSLSVSLTRIPGWQAEGEDELLLIFSDEQPAAAPAPPSRAGIEEAKRGAVERLSGRVSHVANNLLMIIGGYADELLASLPEGDPRRSDVQEIITASGRMARLTQEMTALVRPPVFTAASLDLSAWAPSAAAKLGVALGSVEPRLAAHTAVTLLDQMLAEAVRYLHPHLGPARLVLEARADGGRAVIRLRADGAELPPEVGERIFEPFTGEKVGTDPPLGLAGLVRPWLALNGELDFANQTLTLICPQAVASATRILLVEDEPGIRALIAKTLERQGYAVTECSAAEQALGISTEPGALVTDLSLPGMSGRELAATLRQRWPGLRTLFISGYTNDAELDRQIGSDALPAGTAFLAKPFTTGQLAESLRLLLDAATSPTVA